MYYLVMLGDIDGYGPDIEIDSRETEEEMRALIGVTYGDNVRLNRAIMSGQVYVFKGEFVSIKVRQLSDLVSLLET